MTTQSLPLLPDLIPTGDDYKAAGIAQVLRYLIVLGAGLDD